MENLTISNAICNVLILIVLKKAMNIFIRWLIILRLISFRFAFNKKLE